MIGVILGAVVVAAEIVVSLERVNRIEEINVEDGVMVAGSSLFDSKGILNTGKVL